VQPCAVLFIRFAEIYKFNYLLRTSFIFQLRYLGSWILRNNFFAWVTSRKHRPSAWPPRLQGLRNITLSSTGRPVSTPCKVFANLKFSSGTPASSLLIFSKVFAPSIRRARHREERRFPAPPSADRQALFSGTPEHPIPRRLRARDNRSESPFPKGGRGIYIAAPFFIKVLKIFLPGMHITSLSFFQHFVFYQNTQVRCESLLILTLI